MTELIPLMPFKSESGRKIEIYNAASLNNILLQYCFTEEVKNIKNLLEENDSIV